MNTFRFSNAYAFNIATIFMILTWANGNQIQQQKISSGFKNLPINVPWCSKGSIRYLDLVPYDDKSDNENTQYTDHDLLHTEELLFDAPIVAESDPFTLADYCHLVCARDYGCNAVRTTRANSCIIVRDCISDGFKRKLVDTTNSPKFDIRLMNPTQYELGREYKNMWDYTANSWPTSSNEYQYTTMMYQESSQALYGAVQVGLEKLGDGKYQKTVKLGGPLLDGWSKDMAVQKNVQMLPAWTVPMTWSRQYNVIQAVEIIGGCSGSAFQLKIPGQNLGLNDAAWKTQPPIKNGDGGDDVNQECKWYGYTDIPRLHGSVDNYHTVEITCQNEFNSQHSADIYVQEIQCMRITYLYFHGASHWKSQARDVCQSIPHCYWDNQNYQCYQTQFEPIYGYMIDQSSVGNGKSFYNKRLDGVTLMYFKESDRYACEFRCAAEPECKAVSFYRIGSPTQGNCQLFSKVNATFVPKQVGTKRYSSAIVNVDKYATMTQKARIDALLQENTWRAIHLIKVGRYKQLQRGHATAFKYIKGSPVKWLHTSDAYRCQYFCSLFEECYGITFSSLDKFAKYGNCKLLKIDKDAPQIEYADSEWLWQFHYIKDSDYFDVSKSLLLAEKKMKQDLVLIEHQVRNIEVCSDLCSKNFQCRGFSISQSNDNEFLFYCQLISYCIDIHDMFTLEKNHEKMMVADDDGLKWKHFMKTSGYYYGDDLSSCQDYDDDSDGGGILPFGKDMDVPVGVIIMIVLVAVLFVAYFIKVQRAKNNNGYDMVAAQGRADQWNNVNVDPWAAQREAAPVIDVKVHQEQMRF